ncbi:hypothetical protein [Kitasatospora sp. P5_F3]
MSDFTVWAYAWIGGLVLAAMLSLIIASAPEPYQGRHRATGTTPAPVRIVMDGQRLACWVERENPYEGPLVRPYVDHDAWRAELDEMERQFRRREALRAVAEGLSDPGYTYSGAHTLAGAVA